MNRPGLLLAVCIVAVAAAALAVRAPRLDLRPMHCDEAVQAVNCGKLFDAEVRADYGNWRYDPEEFHGPTLNWLTLPALWLKGTHSFAQSSEADYRIVPVVFGAGLVLLLLLVADGLGRPAAIIAAVLTAVSPAMVFYSRYYIHEMLLVFFTFATLGCAWRYVRSGSLGWALAAGASLGLMHATKETWVLAQRPWSPACWGPLPGRDSAPRWVALAACQPVQTSRAGKLPVPPCVWCRFWPRRQSRASCRSPSIRRCSRTGKARSIPS